MMHNVVIKKRVAAMNVDSYNRTAVFDTAVDNGCVALLEGYSTTAGEEDVWKAKQATADSKGLWMATSPEIVMTRVFDGDSTLGVSPLDYRGIVNDVRAFYNNAGTMVDMTYLNVGDIIEMTGSGIDGIGTEANIYLTPDTTGYKLKAGTTAGAGCTLQKVAKGYLHIGNASMSKIPMPTYKFAVVAN